MKEYLAWAAAKYSLMPEELYVVHGTSYVAALRAKGLGTLMAEVAEYAVRVRGEVTGEPVLEEMKG